MSAPQPIDESLWSDLTSLYEEVMWLANRRAVTPSMARAWYTHVVAGRLCRRVRQFSGQVSRAAASDPAATLRLEHRGRIQTTLTKLVEAHLKLDKPNPDEFVQLVVQHENVHIVTFRENYEAMTHSGDYAAAGIELIQWQSIATDHQAALWKKMLRGKVANANAFVPAR
jgi:hypothetical protein